MRYKALKILAMTAIMALFAIPSGVFAEIHLFAQSEIEHAQAVHARHVEELLRIQGVKGVGIGENLGRLGILVLVDDESRLPNIPGVIEDMSAITQVVGEITAHQINLGVSGGNGALCSGSCAGGTVGFKVCDNTKLGLDGIITNNHVAASGCPNLCPNLAPIGTIFYSPGVIDTNCSIFVSNAVGPLNRFVSLVLDGVYVNYVDAAFVQSTDLLVSSDIQGLGNQNNTVIIPYVTQTVCKSGRTSGMTCGTVTGIGLTVSVSYGSCGTGLFSNAIMYAPTLPYTTMSLPGDSGSPVVDAGTNAAVALNFAGDTINGIGIPIGTMLSELHVSLCSSVSGPSAALAVSPASVIPGSAVTVTFSSVSAPASTDWIGLYAPGAANSAYIDWFYDSSCTKTAGTVKASGSCQYTVPANLPVGTYQLRLFSNNGFTRLAVSNALTVNLTVSPASIVSGGKVTVTFSRPSGSTPLDWIGLYVPGAADTAYLAWFYDSSCTKTAGTVKASGSCQYPVPANLPAGAYEFRLFSKDGFTRLAVSNALTVTPATTLTAAPTTVTRPGTVIGTFSNVAVPTSLDWIGLYASGTANTAYLDWSYDSSCTQIGGVASVSGSCQYTVPLILAAGAYELRLFSNNSFMLLSVSNQFTVN